MSRKVMPKRKVRNQRIRRESDPVPVRYCIWTFVCGLFLVVGFFGAAWLHFSSIDYGIKNSKMRKQIEELESEQRRLLLNKEIALSPSELRKAARKIGLTEMTARNIEAFRRAKPADRGPDSSSLATAAFNTPVQKGGQIFDTASINYRIREISR